MARNRCLQGRRARISVILLRQSANQLGLSIITSACISSVYRARDKDAKRFKASAWLHRSTKTVAPRSRASFAEASFGAVVQHYDSLVV